MKLYYSRPSPFARKVRASAILLGLDRQIELVDTNPSADPPELLAANPLGLIPTLVTDDGLALFDSVVICDYLNAFAATSPIIPPSGAARSASLRLQALGDGIMAAAVLRLKLVRMSGLAEEHPLVLRQKAAVERTLDMLEPQPLGRHADIGLVAVACALGFLDLRFAREPWRDSHPLLAAWFAGIARQDWMMLTDPGI